MLGRILNRFQSMLQGGLQRVAQLVSHWTKPSSASLPLSAVADLARSKPQLIAENLLLRQQLVVLNRAAKRPRFTRADRYRLVLFASWLHTWKDAVLIVKPETVLRWHRQGVQLFWKRKSRPTSCQPKIPLETIILIRELAANNRLWGAERIQGEVLKLNIKVAKRTVQRYMRQSGPKLHRANPGPPSSKTMPTPSGPATSCTSMIYASGRCSPSSSPNSAHGASFITASPDHQPMPGLPSTCARPRRSVRRRSISFVTTMPSTVHTSPPLPRAAGLRY